MKPFTDLFKETSICGGCTGFLGGPLIELLLCARPCWMGQAVQADSDNKEGRVVWWSAGTAPGSAVRLMLRGAHEGFIR